MSKIIGAVQEQSVSGLSLSETFPDVFLCRLREAGSKDHEYKRLIENIISGFESKSVLPPNLQQYWSLKDQLVVHDGLIMFGHRIVVPAAIRKEVLCRLHAAHQGINRTRARARESIFWPGLSNEIQDMVRSCEVCQVHQPSQQQEPMLQDPIPDRIFQSVSSDIFSIGHKYFVVYVDSLSGFPIVGSFTRFPDAADMVKKFKQFFQYSGIPLRLRSDQGTQYSAKVFQDFLSDYGVKWCPSTPHYPQSNGLAEVAVKTIKGILLKMKSPSIESDEFLNALLVYRNTPRNDGYSPNQVLYGHNLRDMIPTHHASFSRDWKGESDRIDGLKKGRCDAKENYDISSRSLNRFRVGDMVRVQDHVSGRWDKCGKVVDIGRFRDYLVAFPSSRSCWRNRRFLRPFYGYAE